MVSDAKFQEKWAKEWDEARKQLNPDPAEKKNTMLTYTNPDGEWGLKGYDIKQVPAELYGAICKLRDYENTGYQPDEIQPK